MPNSVQLFIPKSINETILEDQPIREAAIAKRRREHDPTVLDYQICIYVSAAEMVYIPAEIQQRHLGHTNQDKQPLSGFLLTFTIAELKSYQLDWVAALPSDPLDAKNLKDKLSQSLDFPTDIPGYVFYAAPVTPRIDDNLDQFFLGDRMIFNGDGMIYRLGVEDGQPVLKTRLMKTPCYYADLATQLRPEYSKGLWPFLDGGIVRSSLLLGSRNQANTAFLVTKEQLVVTFDGARPTLIDPDSLEILDAVGGVPEWLGLIPKFLIPRSLEQIFEPYSAPAHPVCDHAPHQNHADAHDLYTANYSQGLTLLNAISVLRKWLLASFGRRGKVFTLPLGGFTDLLRFRAGQPMDRWRLYLPGNQPVIVEQAVHQMALTEDYILLGDIAFELESSQIFGPFWIGYLLAGIRRNKFLHKIQIGRFSTWISQALSRIFFQLVYPLPFANIYLVRRQDLEVANEHLSDEPGFMKLPTPLMAKKITFPREVAHFAVNYRNPNGIITLNATHNPGWDVTEWIGEFDESISHQGIWQKIDRFLHRVLFQAINLLKPIFAFLGQVWGGAQRFYEFLEAYQKLLILDNPIDLRKPLRKDSLIGMSPSPVDLNYLAQYCIDGETGTILKSTYLSDAGDNPTGRNTWSPSVTTYRNLQRDQASESGETIKNMYWMSWGHSWEMIPQRIYLAYKDRDVRTLPIESMDAVTADKPMTLLRLDTEKMEFVDSFEFPLGYFARGPQFIPSAEECPADRDPTTHGYIVCAVLADDVNGLARDEFWIFHADDLKNKPIYRLSHPEVNLGLMIHSTWLPPERMAQARQKYPPARREEMRRQFLQRDYQDLAQKHFCKGVGKLYTDVVEKYFVQQVLEEEVRSALKTGL